MAKRAVLNSVPAQRKIPVPPRWRAEVERILITEDDIARRIAAMSREIQRDVTRRELG